MKIKDIIKGVTEGKVKLHTDPDYFGAEVDDAGFDSLPVVNISADRLVGFEPDSKMNQPKSQANVKKIVAGLKKGDKLPPLLVRKYKKGYQVLDGHHRFWAYKLLGTKSIPVQIVADKDIEEISKQGMAEGLENNNATAQKIFFARSNKTPKGWSYDHVGFITQDGKQIQMSGHKGNDVYVTNDVTDDPEFPKQNIKIVSLSKPVSVPTTNSVGAENCGTFVANVLQANGIKGIDTQKIYSVFKKPQGQGVAEGVYRGDWIRHPDNPWQIGQIQSIDNGQALVTWKKTDKRKKAMSSTHAVDVLQHARREFSQLTQPTHTPGMAEDKSNDTAISLSKLGKFHPGADTLAQFVPERATAQYALHPDKWESTFYSLTNKDSDKLKYYGPKKISIPPGTLVGDMAIANKFYRAKTPEEQEQYAELYKASLQPYPVDVSQYRMPELLIPKQGMAEGFSLGNMLPWPEVVNKINSAMRAMGWKGQRKDDGSFIFTTRGAMTDEYYIVIIDNEGDSMFTYALGTVEEGDTHIGEQDTLPTTEASVSELMNAVRDGFGLNENFADGKNPGRKGLAKRSGVNTKASVSSLRKTAKNSSGEKQRMAHWLANMKAGRAKARRK